MDFKPSAISAQGWKEQVIPDDHPHKTLDIHRHRGALCHGLQEGQVHLPGKERRQDDQAGVKCLESDPTSYLPPKPIGLQIRRSISLES